jgi:hypothetical protein
VRQSIHEIYELGKTIICYSALSSKVVVICRDKPAEEQLAVWGGFQQINKLPTEQSQLGGKRRTDTLQRICNVANTLE